MRVFARLACRALVFARAAVGRVGCCVQACIGAGDGSFRRADACRVFAGSISRTCFVTTAAIRRVIRRVRTYVAALRLAADAGAVLALGPLVANLTATAAVIVVRALVHAIASALVLGWALARSGNAFLRVVTVRLLVNDAVAVVVLAIAFLVRTRVAALVAVVAIIAPADLRWMAVAILVQYVEQTN